MAYSPKLFVANSFNISGNNVVYTVPAGRRAIVTEWDWFNNTLGGGDLTVSTYTAGYSSPHGGILTHQLVLRNGKMHRAQGFYVLEAGDSLISAQGAGVTWHQVNGLEGDVADKIHGGTPIRFLHKTTAAVEQVVYIVPTGRTLVIKTITALNVNPGTLGASIRVGAAPIALDWAVVDNMPPGQDNGVAKQFDGTWLVPAGTAITVNQWGAGDGISFAFHGVLI